MFLRTRKTDFWAVIFFFFCFLSSISAQEFYEPKDNDYRRIWSLQLGAASGFGSYRDMGTAPMSYYGIMMQPTLGLHFVLPTRMEFSVVSRNAIGFLEDAAEPMLNFDAFDINSNFRLKALARIGGGDAMSNVVKLYLGIGIANFLDITINPNYENAATGISDFMGPELIGRLYFEPRWNVPILFHGEAAAMPIAAVLRPGYAYIDNYTAYHPVSNALFSDFEIFAKPFAAVSTDIGIDIATGPGSRIAFSYLWNYHTTGKSGIWRFDHATHYLAIDFLIKLRAKR